MGAKRIAAHIGSIFLIPRQSARLFNQTQMNRVNTSEEGRRRFNNGFIRLQLRVPGHVSEGQSHCLPPGIRQPMIGTSRAKVLIGKAFKAS